MEFRKNEYVTVKIDDIGSEGEGIGKVDGFTLFVKDAVVGDLVEAKIVKKKKNYAYARLEKVVEPSPFRVEPKCACYRRCGGCQLQALAYEQQLIYKQAKIRNNLIHIGGFAPEYVDERMEPIIGMEEPFRYRNKAQYPVGTDRAGNVVTGFYAGRTHDIVANTDCWLGVEENEEILSCILAYLRRNHIRAYDEATGTGLVRYVLIRKGFTSGDIMVCLVLNLKEGKGGDGFQEKQGHGGGGFWEKQGNGGDGFQEKQVNGGGGFREKQGNGGGGFREKQEHGGGGFREKQGNGRDGFQEKQGKICGSFQVKEGNGCGGFLPKQEELIKGLAGIRGMASVSVSINAERTNVIMGKEIHTIWGSDTISDTIHVRDMTKPGYPFTGEALTFRISPLSFYQVNPIQTEKLYSLVLEYAALTGRETVWDLYCGIGTISLFLARSAGKVYGVEVVQQAVEDARENAAGNGITNAEFFVGKAEDVLQEFYRKECGGGWLEGDGGRGTGLQRPDVIVVDPPRKGCDEACLAVMLEMQPERIVYVSCDPSTLARDLKVLCGGGYEVKKVRGTDMFGMTVHVETVCLLGNGNAKPDTRVKLSVATEELQRIKNGEKI